MVAIRLGSVVLAGFLGIGDVQGEQTLGVFVDTKDELSPGVRQAMEDEFERVIQTPGLIVAWNKLDDHAAGKIFNRVVVVRLRGACTGRHPPEFEPAGRRTLGFTHVSNGAVLPFAEVECDRVRSVLHPVTCSEDLPEREILVGRALGRVLAHEIFHVVTRSTGHSRKGIARDCFTPKDLTCDDFGFEDECVNKMRESLNLASVR